MFLFVAQGLVRRNFPFNDHLYVSDLLKSLFSESLMRPGENPTRVCFTYECVFYITELVLTYCEQYTLNMWENYDFHLGRYTLNSAE